LGERIKVRGKISSPLGGEGKGEGKDLLSPGGRG